MRSEPSIAVRNTRPEDFEQIRDISRRVYPNVAAWGVDQLASHLTHFPEGQFVAVSDPDQQVIGMAASLIVAWEDYDFETTWRDMTDRGYFTNHDPESGRTLYGAEIMVDPAAQGRGAGSAIYKARRALTERLGLLRIRAGARLRDYNRHATEMDAEEYVRRVIHGQIFDRTLSFQLKQGFRVLAVTEDYLGHDPSSLGYAAVIEWINEGVATEEIRHRQQEKIHARHLD